MPTLTSDKVFRSYEEFERDLLPSRHQERLLDSIKEVDLAASELAKGALEAIQAALEIDSTNQSD